MSELSTFSPRARGRARGSALQALYEWRMTDKPIADIEAEFSADRLAKNIDWNYFQELLQAVSSQDEQVDMMLETTLDRSLTGLGVVERMVLYIAIYELQNRIDIPFRVVINEAIELVKRFGAEGSYKCVNAVLDKLAVLLRVEEANTD